MDFDESIEEVRKELRDKAKPALWYALEENPELASDIVIEALDKILDIIVGINRDLGERIEEVNAELGKRIEEVDRRLGERIEEVNAELGKRIEEVDRRLGERIEEVNAELGKRIEEVDRRLGERIEEVSKNVDRISRAVSTLASTVGKLDRRYARLEEIELRMTLERLCFSSGFRVDRGVIEPGKPAVDAIITGRGIVALVEIAMKGDTGDINQLIKASKVYKEVHGVKPKALFLLSVEEPDKLTYVRARNRGVIVTMRPGRIVEVLEKIAK